MNKLNIEYDYNSKLCFHAQWYCDDASSTKRLYLSYFPYDGSIELYDVDCKRMFLKRIASEHFPLKDFFAGNTIFMYGRQIEIGDYLNDFTRNIISVTKEHTFVLIKPSMVHMIGFFINFLQDNGYTIFRMRMAMFTRLEALAFYSSEIGDVFLPFKIEHIISGRVVGMEVVGYNAVREFLELLGPDDPVLAKLTHPHSLRAKFGESRDVNAFHGSANHTTAQKEAEFFFGTANNKRALAPTCIQKNTACCVLKTHVVDDGNFGHVLTSIEEHPLFHITALKMMYLTTTDCEAYLEMYSGGMTRFHDQVLGYVSGRSVALEIATKYEGINVHYEFKRFVGPIDPVIAKEINPLTLRAMYGINRYENAIHVNELESDSKMDLQYLFKIID